MNIPEQVRPITPRPPAFGKGLMAGLIGGAVGSLTMIAAQGAWSRAFGLGLRPAEHDVAGDGAPVATGRDPSTVRGAKRLVGLVSDLDLTSSHEQLAGRLFHFAFGVGLGGFYGVLVEYFPVASVGSGAPFGALQMLLADECSVPALGLSESPTQAPPAAHLGSLAARVGYSLTTEQVRRIIRARL